MDRPQLVISASRRTDLPGFFADWTISKIRRKRRPIHSVFFWTKHPEAFSKPQPLADFTRHGIANPFLLLTVTGLGGSAIEPNVPAWRDVEPIMPEIVKTFHGDPRRIRWRFDPVLPGVGAEKLFHKIAPKMRELGIRDCIISMPAAISLKGALCEQYAAAGLGQWEDASARATVEKILDRAEKYAIKVFSCAAPKVTRWFGSRIEPASCISATLATSLHPEKIVLEHCRDPYQRKRCTCTKSEDIGSYRDTLCGSGCVYCYSKAGGPHIGTNEK